jgi:hypothetical protein
VKWIHLVQYRDQWRNLVNSVMNLQSFNKIRGIPLTSLATIQELFSMELDLIRVGEEFETRNTSKTPSAFRPRGDRNQHHLVMNSH